MTRLYEKKQYCDFGSSKKEIEDLVMTDKFFMSMPQYIKQELIKDRKLTFESAVRQAKELESSRNQARELSVSTKEKPFLGGVNRIQERSRIECYRCKSFNHKSDSDKCPEREARFFACGFKGHFANARFCKKTGRAKREAPRSRNEYESNAKKRKINVRNIEDKEDIICNVNSAGVNVVCQIGKVHVRMLVDSGTNRNIIDDKTWKLMVAKGFLMKEDEVFPYVKESIDDGNFEKEEVKDFKFCQHELAYVGDIILRGKNYFVLIL